MRRRIQKELLQAALTTCRDFGRNDDALLLRGIVAAVQETPDETLVIARQGPDEAGLYTERVLALGPGVAIDDAAAKIFLNASPFTEVSRMAYRKVDERVFAGMVGILGAHAIAQILQGLAHCEHVAPTSAAEGDAPEAPYVKVPALLFSSMVATFREHPIGQILHALGQCPMVEDDAPPPAANDAVSPESFSSPAVQAISAA